jgi:transposase
MSILAFDLGDFNADSAWKWLDRETGEVREGVVCTNPESLQSLLGKLQPSIVLCEACVMTVTLQEAVAAVLPGADFRAANTNADAWRWAATKCKTDRRDCDRLIDLFQIGRLETVYIPSAPDRSLRRLVLHRSKLVEKRTSCYLTVRSLCKQHHVQLARGEKAWSESELKRLEALAQPVARRDLLQVADEDFWLLEVCNALQQIRLLDAQIGQLEKLLVQELKRRPQAKMLRTAPGVGPVLAATVLAFIGEPRRFQNAKQVAAYAGLVPRVYQSGKSNVHGHITKAGNRRLRNMLINAAWSAVRCSAWAKDLFERLTGGSSSKPRRKVAIVAVARRLFIRCWAMLRDQSVWRESVSTAQTA